MRVLIGMILFGFIFSHPYHVSVCEINHDSKNNTLKIANKVIIDDLENALKIENGSKVDLIKMIDNKEGKDVINNYILKHLKIKLEGKTVVLDFVGCELEDESIWIYHEVIEVRKIKSITIHNSILIDFFDSQINLVHMDIAGKKNSFKLNKGDVERKTIF